MERYRYIVVQRVAGKLVGAWNTTRWLGGILKRGKLVRGASYELPFFAVVGEGSGGNGRGSLRRWLIGMGFGWLTTGISFSFFIILW